MLVAIACAVGVIGFAMRGVPRLVTLSFYLAPTVIALAAVRFVGRNGRARMAG